MRHRKRTAKLGRTTEHRNSMLANMVCSLIKQSRKGGSIKTTLAKAKAARVVAEKMVTIGKKGQDKNKTVHFRRLAASRLRAPSRTFFEKKGKILGRERRAAWREQEDVVHILFDELALRYKDRNGGYTRVIKLGRRKGDAAEMAILEWVGGDKAVVTDTETAAPTETKAEPKTKEEKPGEEKAEEKASEADAEEKVETEETSEEETADTPEVEAVEEEYSEEKAETEAAEEEATEGGASVEATEEKAEASGEKASDASETESVKETAEEEVSQKEVPAEEASAQESEAKPEGSDDDKKKEE